MTKPLHHLTAVVATMIALTSGVGALADWEHDEHHKRKSCRDKRPTPKVVALSDARLKIELNGTDDDVGIQVFIDADPWEWMDIYDTHGRLLFRADTKGRFAKQGGTELFMESGEPNFDELSLEDFLKRFPEGKYSIRGKGIEGERFIGSASQ